MSSTYLYGIVDSGEVRCPCLTGIDGTSPVSIIVHQGLGGVVSQHQGNGFQDLPKEKLVRYLLAHQQVVEQVMQRGPILPVRFGALFGSTQEVFAVLAQGHEKLSKARAAIHDKVEVEVAATWDIQRVMKEIGQEEEIVRAGEVISRKGRLSLEEQLRLGEMVKRSMDRRREGHRGRMMELLNPISIATVSNALISDEMVMNVAFLIDRSRQEEFDGEVRHLDRQFDSQITFRVIGPLPPYSFSTVRITRLAREQVEEARRRLNLALVSSEEMVRQSYRRMAAQAQRDGGAAGLSPQDGTTKLKEASDLLIQYCRAMKERDGGGGPFHPAQEPGRDLYIICIDGLKGDGVESAPAR